MNLLLIITAIVLVWKIREGYRKGMVREIVSFISLIVLSLILILIAGGLSSYMNGDYIGLIAVVVFFCVLLIAHHLINLALFPAKVLSKLPLIRTGDRLLGIVAGAMETLVFLWTFYCFGIYWGSGIYGERIMSYVEDSRILSALYDYNLLADLAGRLFT